MRILADTHAWLLLRADADLLSPQPGEVFADDDVVFSAASAWEIATKAAIGRLEYPGDLAGIIVGQVRQAGITELPMTIDHAIESARLPIPSSRPVRPIVCLPGAA